MKHIQGLLVALVFSIGLNGAAMADKPAAGTVMQAFNLVFTGPGDSFSFDVDAAQGAGTLTVETADCCIAGDLWVSFLQHGQPQGKDVAIGTGDGTSSLSGAATRKGWSKGTVTITYDSGTDIFSAGMTVKFSYSSEGKGKAKGNTGMNITPLP